MDASTGGGGGSGEAGARFGNHWRTPGRSAVARGSGRGTQGTQASSQSTPPPACRPPIRLLQPRRLRFDACRGATPSPPRPVHLLHCFPPFPHRRSPRNIRSPHQSTLRSQLLRTTRLVRRLQTTRLSGEVTISLDGIGLLSDAGGPSSGSCRRAAGNGGAVVVRY